METEVKGKAKKQAAAKIIKSKGNQGNRQGTHDKAFGFCFYNNVALAAKHAVDTHGLERVLIVDWDVHHGDGIQDMFKDDYRVMYVSLHRRDLFPYKDVEGECKGDCSYVGEGNGVGYTMNIAWPEGDMGSAEYLAAFWQLVMPVARQFNPQLVLVAAGFDAAIGDDLGGCKVDPDCYGHLTHLLSSLAQGRVAIFLEGGYNISSVSKSVVMCAKALLGYPLPALAPFTGLRPAAVQTISKSSKAHLPYWSILANKVEHSTQLVVKALSQLSLEPEIRLKKIGPQELAGRVRLGCLNPLDCPPELAEEVASSSVRARNSCPPCASGDEKDAQIQVLEDRVAKLKIRLDETQREIKELQLDNERLRCKN